MNAETLAALGEPNRLRIVELLRAGPRPVNDIQGRLGLRQSQVSQHLKVLRDSGLATVRPEGTRRLYAVNSEPLRELDAWLDRFRRFWTPHLEALATELARGRRERRLGHPSPSERGKNP